MKTMAATQWVLVLMSLAVTAMAVTVVWMAWKVVEVVQHVGLGQAKLGNIFEPVSL